MPIPTTFEIYSDGGGASSSDAVNTTSLVPSIPYQSPDVVVPASSVNCLDGNYFKKTVDGNITFQFTNAPSNGAYSFTLEVVHTSGTITWPTSVLWYSGTAPTLTTGKTDLFMFSTSDGGTTWRGSYLLNYTG